MCWEEVPFNTSRLEKQRTHERTHVVLGFPPLTIGHKGPEAGVVEVVDVAVRLPPRKVIPHVLCVCGISCRPFVKKELYRQTDASRVE